MAKSQISLLQAEHYFTVAFYFPILCLEVGIQAKNKQKQSQDYNNALTQIKKIHPSLENKSSELKTRKQLINNGIVVVHTAAAKLLYQHRSP